MSSTIVQGAVPSPLSALNPTFITTVDWSPTSSVSTLCGTQKTSELCIGANTNTGSKSLTATLNLQANGVETGRISVSFSMCVPSAAMNQGGPAGITLFQWGGFEKVGTITLQYMPVIGALECPHVLVLSVYGDEYRTVTVPINAINQFQQVYIEYDGMDLILVCGNTADRFSSGTTIAPPTSPNQLLFGADCAGLYFLNLEIFNSAILEQSLPETYSFPYILWDNPDSGIIAVIPTPYLPDPSVPDNFFMFIDQGYTAGHSPAQLDLTTSDQIMEVMLYVNDRSVVLPGFMGGSTSQFLSYITTVNAGVVQFPFDGKMENIKFTSVGGNLVSAEHYRGANTGQMSFTVRLEGIMGDGISPVVGGSWSKNVPIIGKIPQQFYLPHTGEPNKGISILGTTTTMATPKGISVTYRDDDVRTTGKIIGSIANRPGANICLTRLSPTNFFGSDQVPFPVNSIIAGNPNQLSYSLPTTQLYCYGVYWERYMMVSPPDVVMSQAPYNRATSGIPIAAFSIDIPVGQTLRGIDICFTAVPPGLIGNGVPPKSVAIQVPIVTRTYVDDPNGSNDQGGGGSGGGGGGD